MTVETLLDALSSEGVTTHEKAVAVLWLRGGHDVLHEMTSAEICAELEATGLPTQNTSRVSLRLSQDKRVVKGKKIGAWRLHSLARKALNEKYQNLVKVRKVSVQTDSVLPANLFRGTRGYIEKVVSQLNASFDHGLFDCCAVMCRRLLETLIIEVYEAHDRAGQIKTADGSFFMLSGLLAYIESDKAFNLGRNAVSGLREFKKLGDLSAHNRRFNAQESDITRIREGMRIAAEELLHLAKLI